MATSRSTSAGVPISSTADLLRPAGVGVLWQQFQALKDRLQAEGLFDQARKRAIPRWPQRIGIVTSPTGAALQDMLKVLRERYPLVQVFVASSLVQGAEAPASLVRGIEALNALGDIDVIVLARGGGSIEDLWAFNDERPWPARWPPRRFRSSLAWGTRSILPSSILWLTLGRRRLRRPQRRWCPMAPSC